MAKNSLIGMGMVLLILVAGLSGCAYWRLEKGQYTGNLKTFDSYEELRNFVTKGVSKAGGSLARWVAFDEGVIPAPEYSTTNVQVAGVDEADIVKTDGEYIYKVVNAGYRWWYEDSGADHNRVVIIKAEDGKMEVVSEINISESIAGIFINWDRLGIIGNQWGYQGPETVLYIYDLKDRANPTLVFNYSVSGSYSNSRMIGGWIYLISSQWIYVYDNETIPLPAVKKNGEGHVIPAEEIQYIDAPQPSYSYTIISAINITTGESDEKAFVIGESSTIYVSLSYINGAPISHLYLTTTNRWWVWARSDNLPSQETSVYMFSINGKNIEHKATGKVIGHVLNQFSMDEYNGYFRIATTKERNWWGESDEPSTNNVYVLDEDMVTVGKLEGLAKGESIYATRFMGNRCYLVTFVKIDPLFVIDLSDPTNPKVLGELKIPGYSDYLHPYDENHIIGIGKNAEPATDDDRIWWSQNFAWYQGIKIALFDVSDPENPNQISEVIVGDRGTESEALHDHHAFLFDRKKNLLVIPITLAKINPEEYDGNPPSWAYGNLVWEGAYVFNITLDGITYVGNITHQKTKYSEKENKTYHYYDNNSDEIAYISPGDSINITLEYTTGYKWVLVEDYDHEVLEKTDEGDVPPDIIGGLLGKTGHQYFVFKSLKEGSTRIYFVYQRTLDKRIERMYKLDIYISRGMGDYWYPDYNYQVRRSLYINNTLYTISNFMIKSNSLADLSEIDSLDVGI